MTRLLRSTRPCWLWLLGLGLLAPTPGRAQEPANAPAEAAAVRSLRPQPPFEIPADPPPHEGALIDIPLTIEPPDIVVVEVLMALPGRPITGERLIRPDGTISLGFYGVVHVRGLTLEQAKVKIVLHLREFMTDAALDLVKYPGDLTPAAAEEEDMPADMAPGTDTPAGLPPPPNLLPDTPRARDPQPPEPKRSATAGPGQGLRVARPRTRPASFPAATRATAPAGPVPQLPELDDVAAAFAKRPRDPMEQGGQPVDPAQSHRVFVDIVSFNSKTYSVLGDVGTPGRLPFTGKETVLDAITFAGGLTSTAEPTDIHLHRPGVSGKPARDYPIDHAAILRGEARANLQIFPNDRLIVGRNAIVKKAIEIDRNLAPLNSVFNAALMQSFTLRSLGAAMGDVPGSTPAQRDEALKRWLDFLWQGVDPRAPLTPDQQTLRDALMKKLDSRAEARERAGVKDE